VLGLVYAGLLASLAALCVWAAAEQGVTAALAQMAGERWGLTTLVDLYTAFFSVWLWIAWRERSLSARLAWAVLIAGLGSMAIAAYVLLALRRLPAGAGASALLQPAAEPLGGGA
jgi:hypothetical protein